MKFLKKHWKNVLFLIGISLFFIPQTGMPIRVFFNKMMAFSPSEIVAEERVTFDSYNWNLISLDKQRVNFSQSEGRVVVINFWATWCPPCVAELPSLQELYDQYGDRVDFYLISSERDETVKRFLQKKKYSLPFYLEVEIAPELLQTRSIPRTFVLSKSGEIIIDKSGVANWNSESMHESLNRLLK